MYSWCSICDSNNKSEIDFKQEIDTTKIQQEKVPDSIAEVNAFVDAVNAQDSVFDDGTIPSAWWEAGFKNSVTFKIFVDDVKTWVKKSMIDSIAAHIKFPLKNINNATDFKANYNKIFTDSLQKKIAQQRLDRISRNAKGAMIADGAVWFNEMKGKYFITAINNK